MENLRRSFLGGTITGKFLLNSASREPVLGEYKNEELSPKNVSMLINDGDEAQSSTASGRSGSSEEDRFSLTDDSPDSSMKIIRYTNWALFELACLVLFIIVLGCTLTIPTLRNKYLYDLYLWKWEVLIFVVICGRLLSGLVIQIIVNFIERSFLLPKWVLYFVYCLAKAAKKCIWWGLILIVWRCILAKKVESMTYGKKVSPNITKFCICALVGTVVWSLKALSIEFLVSSFHVKTFFERIQVSLLNQHVINALMDAQEEREQVTMEEREKLQNGNHDNGIPMDSLLQMNDKNIIPWNMNRMMDVISMPMSITALDESFTHITREEQARGVAQKIFFNFAKPSSEHLDLTDLKQFVGYDKLVKKIQLFDGASESKGISKEAIKTWVVNMFRERRDLALSLEDTKEALNKIYNLLSVVVGIIIFIICLFILDGANFNFHKYVGALIFLVSFVFGNTCKTTLEALTFLFVVHPFDVGDRCEINGDQMIVNKINILTTVFLKYDGTEITNSNSVLSTMSIANYRRSRYMSDAIDFGIQTSTSPEKVAKMKEMLRSYVENNSEHWNPDLQIIKRDVVDSNRFKTTLLVSHRMNFQDMDERFRRRTLLVEEMGKIFKDLDIEYSMIPMEISVDSLPAALDFKRVPLKWK